MLLKLTQLLVHKGILFFGTASQEGSFSIQRARVACGLDQNDLLCVEDRQDDPELARKCYETMGLDGFSNWTHGLPEDPNRLHPKIRAHPLTLQIPPQTFSSPAHPPGATSNN